jgi:hypothetical protein
LNTVAEKSIDSFKCISGRGGTSQRTIFGKSERCITEQNDIAHGDRLKSRKSISVDLEGEEAGLSDEIGLGQIEIEKSVGCPQAGEKQGES